MEKSSFFNSINGDRRYKASDFAEYFNSFIGNGVFPNPSTNLQVISNSNMTVTIKSGKAWINGYIYINTDDLVLNVDVADGILNRIDKVVLRMNVADRIITTKIKKGTFTSTPVAPTLQRDADAYEIALADIYISKGTISITQANITDLRLNKELCGIVHGTIEQVDTTAIFNQFQYWYSQKQDEYNADIETWTNEKKQAFDTWYTTNTTAFMEQFNSWYETNTTQWGNEFTTWFNTIKGQLDGDIAANLAAKTIELEGKIKTLAGASGENEKLNKSEFDTFKTKTESSLSDMTTMLNDIEDDLGNVVAQQNKLIDDTTGVKYAWGIENGQLYVEEVAE